MKNVLIVNNHPIIRLSLSYLLTKEGMTIIDDVSTSEEALACIKKDRVDLLLVDIDPPLLSGLDLITKIRRSDYSTRIIVMGDQNSGALINHALSVGANGYVNTRDDIKQITNAVNAVMSGYMYFPLTEDYSRYISQQPEDKSSLSLRELQILKQLITGKKGIHIADELNLSFKTISTYKYRIMKKLNVKSMVELLEYARETGA